VLCVPSSLVLREKFISGFFFETFLVYFETFLVYFEQDLALLMHAPRSLLMHVSGSFLMYASGYL
jgi:hypothetical protein